MVTPGAHKQRNQFDFLVEDDEFEEFEEEDWGKHMLDQEDAQQWEEDWEDGEEDDFSRQLRVELQKAVAAGTAQQ